jgi:hypothetical protein
MGGRAGCSGLPDTGGGPLRFRAAFLAIINTDTIPGAAPAPSLRPFPSLPLKKRSFCIHLQKLLFLILKKSQS